MNIENYIEAKYRELQLKGFDAEFSDLYKKLSKVKIIKLFLKRYCPFVNKLVVYRRAKRANE